MDVERYGLALPGGQPVRLLRSYQRVVRVAQPAVNTDWSTGPDGGHLWRVLAWEATLQTDANVANRVVAEILTTPDGEVLRLGSNAAQPAGTTFRYSGIRGLSQVVADTTRGIVDLPMLDALIPPGWTFGVATTNRQVGDQWSSIRPLVEEYVIGAAEDPVAELAEAIHGALSRMHDEGRLVYR